MANPKSLLELLGYLTGSGGRADRLRAMANARKRFTMVAPDARTGLPKITGHRQDILEPEHARALRDRGGYISHTPAGISPERHWIQRNPGTPPPWWEESVARGTMEPDLVTTLDDLGDPLYSYPPRLGTPTNTATQQDRVLIASDQQDKAVNYFRERLGRMADPSRRGGSFRRGTGTFGEEDLFTGNVRPNESLENFGWASTPSGSPTYRHETLHGLLSAMTPEEAKTMPLPFRMAHWKRWKNKGGDWQGRLADEVQAWAGSNRGDAMKGLKEFLGPQEGKSYYPDPTISHYLRGSYGQRDLADLYRVAYENRKALVGTGAAALTGAGAAEAYLRSTRDEE